MLLLLFFNYDNLLNSFNAVTVKWRASKVKNKIYTIIIIESHYEGDRVDGNIARNENVIRDCDRYIF